MTTIRDLLDFIRPGICISAAFLSVAGSLLTKVSLDSLVLSAAISFFACAVIYSYNNMKDFKEDVKNGRRISPFASKTRTGLFVVTLLMVFTVILSLMLGIYATVFSSAFVLTGILYSKFRIKQHAVIKNLYTTFPLSLLFLFGAGTIDSGTLFYYAIIFTVLLIGTIVSDLRDYEGDKATGVNTLPVIFGRDVTKQFVFILTVSISLAMLFDIRKLFILFIFSLGASVLLLKNQFKLAHKFGMVSFIFFDIWMLVI
jgi:4-hydroxybenzoate polyprenyltransferase